MSVFNGPTLYFTASSTTLVYGEFRLNEKSTEIEMPSPPGTATFRRVSKSNLKEYPKGYLSWNCIYLAWWRRRLSHHCLPFFFSHLRETTFNAICYTSPFQEQFELKHKLKCHCELFIPCLIKSSSPST